MTDSDFIQQIFGMQMRSHDWMQFDRGNRPSHDWIQFDRGGGVDPHTTVQEATPQKNSSNARFFRRKKIVRNMQRKHSVKLNFSLICASITTTEYSLMQILS